MPDPNQSQEDDLRAAGCERIFSDVASGAKSARPGLQVSDLQPLMISEQATDGTVSIFGSVTEGDDWSYVVCTRDGSGKWRFTKVVLPNNFSDIVISAISSSGSIVGVGSATSSASEGNNNQVVGSIPNMAGQAANTASTSNANGARHAVVLLPVQVASVSFTNDPSASPPNYSQIESDSVDPTSGLHTQYSAPQWADANDLAGTSGWDSNPANTNEHDNPVACVQNTKPCIGATFKIPGASHWSSLKFKATGPDGISIPATTGTLDPTDTTGATVIMPPTDSTTALPSTIKYYNKAEATSFTLNWSLSVDGGNTWSAINSTKHTVYVVLGAPTYTAANEETPFYIGCSSANGKSTQSDMINAIWAKIQTLNVNMVATTSAMTYYQNSAAPYTTPNGLSGLLNPNPNTGAAAGDGRCGSFQILMLQTLYDQGIPLTTAVPLAVTPTTDYVSAAEAAYQTQNGVDPPTVFPTIRNAFFVKHWTLNTATPFNPIRLQGAPAQGNTQPIAIFGDHAVIQITQSGTTQYYDPSYGTGPFASMTAWQDASLDDLEFSLSITAAWPQISFCTSAARKHRESRRSTPVQLPTTGNRANFEHELMKPSLIGVVVFLGIMFITVTKADTERYGRAEAADKNGSITAVHRLSNGQSWLVLRKDNADLLKITATGFLVNLEDAWLQDGQLAVVLDSDLSLTYQLYSQQGGNWQLQRQTAFYPLNVSTRASLLLVQMPNLTNVVLTCTKKGDVAREAGVTKPDDPKITFTFATDGTVLKDEHPYHLKSGVESP